MGVTRVLGSIFGRVYRPSAKMTHLWLSKFFFFAIFVISSEAKARVNFEAVPDNCKSCIKDVMHAFEVCKEAADHHPKEFFQCVQDVLKATSKCLECVCDIIKAIKPDFPCTSGEIISLDDMNGGLFCYNDHDCSNGWQCIGAIPPFIPGICVPFNGAKQWKQFSNAWDNKQCRLVARHKSMDLEQCQNNCQDTEGCNAINHSARRKGICLHLGCPLNSTGPTATKKDFKGYSLIQSMTVGHVCAKPKNWCFGPSEASLIGNRFQWIDADGDGIPDPTCTNAGGYFLAILSTKNCKQVNGNGPFSSWKGCAKPKNWCFGGTKASLIGNRFQWIDADGDGIPDPTCTNAGGPCLALLSTQNCKQVYGKGPFPPWP